MERSVPRVYASQVCVEIRSLLRGRGRRGRIVKERREREEEQEGRKEGRKEGGKEMIKEREKESNEGKRNDLRKKDN